MRIQIKATTATELSQINTGKSGGAGVNPIILIKKQKVLVQNSKGNKVIATTPIFTGNSFRGKLRRKALEHLLEKIVEKDLKMPNAVNFNLMNAGGGNDFQTQLFETVDKVRELNPIISVFGASLAIEGKIITPNLIPYRTVEDGILEYYFNEDDEGNLYSTIKTTETFIKTDDLLTRSGNARYLDDDKLKEWNEKVADNNKKRASERAADNKKDDKTKKESIRAINDREFIVRGTDLYTSITSSSEMTPVERGMIYKALEDVSLDTLGSNKARNFGKMNYQIKMDDESELKTNTDCYLTSSITKKVYSNTIQEDIKAYENWLDEITEENYKIAEIMS